MRLYNSHLSNAVIKGSKDYQAYKKLGMDVLKFSVKFENKK